jgi:hypothetical protein
MPSEQPTISFALLHQVGEIPGAPGAGPPLAGTPEAMLTI